MFAHAQRLLVCALVALLAIFVTPRAAEAAGAKAPVAKKTDAKAATKRRQSMRRRSARIHKQPTKDKGPKTSKGLTLGERLKFSRVNKFEGKVGALRKQVTQQLSTPEANLKTARAAIIRLMDTGFLRVGSQQYANKSEKPTYGASSLLKEHVTVKGNNVTIAFRGKSGVSWKKTLKDPALTRALRLFLKLPGARLFQYLTPTGKMVRVTETQVRKVLQPFGAKPKDFRTLHANRLFKQALSKLPKPKTEAEAKSNLLKARDIAAKALNHLPTTSEASYLHPVHAENYRALVSHPARGPPQ